MFLLLGPVIDDNSVLFLLKEPLREMIDPDFQLPAILLSQKVLSDSERQVVKSKESLQQRNDALIKFLRQRGETALIAFIACLLHTDQEHVYNFIQCDGGKQFLVVDVDYFINKIKISRRRPRR